MARLPRYAVPGQPEHVIVRGNNRTAIFGERVDYERFRDDLIGACTRHQCVVHAYVLMTNHVHLLMTGRVAGAIGRSIQSLGRRYVAYFNRRNQRTGTLWEGRYRSMPVDSARYLFTCYRYIEQNPVRAGMVNHAAIYPWSSFHANALGTFDPIVTPHEQYLALAPGMLQRLAIYSEICAVPFDATTLDEVRSAIRGGWALGSVRFRDDVTTSAGRRASPLKKLQTRVRPNFSA